MSRSGYSDDYDGENPFSLIYPSIVNRSIRGVRGQKFLRELAAAMDAMEIKRLIANELINDANDCCTIGVLCKARGVDVKGLDVTDADLVGSIMDISASMTREIVYENDQGFNFYNSEKETPEERWIRMRKWVDENIIQEPRKDDS